MWSWGGGGGLICLCSQLLRVPPVVFLYILLATVMALVAVLTTGALLYKYWIEIVLLYRTYQSKDETLRGKTT